MKDTEKKFKIVLVSFNSPKEDCVYYLSYEEFKQFTFDENEYNIIVKHI